ncbi:hypothetical protein B0J17DRAFT_713152 [Rhizoctonia solani]|nr:hypothetical protein B0J17DRAFT_713152 [Rhizoctonia solani]
MSKTGLHNTERRSNALQPNDVSSQWILPSFPPGYVEKPSSGRTSCTDIDTNDDIVFALQTLHDSAGSFALLQDAVLSCLDVLKHPMDKSQEYGPLFTEIRALDAVLQRRKGPECGRISDCAINLALSIKDQVQTLDTGKECDSESSLVLYLSEEQAGISIEPIVSLFRQLRIELNACNLSDHLKTNKLEQLSPVKLAYDSSASPVRQLCARGTCIRALSELAYWETTTCGVYWMTGLSGTGKSTIATTFSHRLDEKKRLAASFFCSRLFLERRQVNRIIPTIAYQLAHYSMVFRAALSEALERNADIRSTHIASQFDCLLKKPLIAVDESIPRNLVIVLDGLDECDDQADAELLLSLLIQGSETLPVRFFIATRSMTVTRQAIGSAVFPSGQLEDLLIKEDIKRYLEYELSDISLTIDQMEHLVCGSGTLFIYAATLAQSIRYFSRSVSLESLLQSMTPKSTGANPNIYHLYEAILLLVLSHEKGSAPTAARNLGLVLMVVSYAQGPIDINTVSGLTGIEDRDTITSMLNPLQSLLTVSKNGMLSITHPSFSGFISDRVRLATLFGEPEGYTRYITQQCFQVMKKQLCFNICDLNSSYRADDSVKDLDSRVKAAVSSTLSYACRYWGYHLHLSPWSSLLQDELQDFLSVRLLFWMEVMNLKRLMDVGPDVLLKAQQWIKNASGPSNLECHLDDARQFVQRFATTAISRSTPHIYISTLLFWPRFNFVSKCYRERIHGLVKTAKKGLCEDIEAVATWRLDSEAKSIAYSPNGARVAFGCENGAVEVRDIGDSHLLSGAAKVRTTSMVSQSHSSSHSGTVWSVALSPDGQHVASGSSDCTVRIWKIADEDKNSGHILKGHNGCVLSVAYSPNGELVASGSKDCNVFIWNSLSGEAMRGPLEGHSGAVSSVTFSPGGRRVASGSWDRSIRVWDPYNGTLIAGPFVGHTHSINSISFSPNGAYLVSTSSNTSIGVWDSLSGLGITDTGLEVFPGHTSSACSAAFSSDTKYIISGSSDQTIRIWDLPTGKPIGSPLYALVEPVTSLVISPDGKHVASCSNDRNVQLWRFPNAQIADSQTISKTITRRTVYSTKRKDDQFPKGWKLSSDGWIVAKDSSLLLWVPSNIHISLSPSGSDHICTLIDYTGLVEVNLSDLPLDGRWRRCYRTN